MSDCGCGTPDGERAAAALKDFAESFAERNPHLRVFNMVLHMDEATPHLHVDFIPVATEQSRGLSTRVSMKQALKQQGFVGVGRKQTEWAAWMEREKEALTEIAQRHDFEIISLGTNRPHMDLPQFKEAAARLEAVQQQTAAVEREVAELERQRDALKGTVRLLKEADRVNAPLHDIQPEKTLTGAVKGVTVDQVEQLKKMALRSVTDRHKVQELTEENTRLRSQVPSMKKRLEEAQRQQRLEQENRRLRDENYICNPSCRRNAASPSVRRTASVGCWTSWKNTCRSVCVLCLKRRGSCCPIRRLDSSRSNSSTSEEWAAWSCKRSLSGGLENLFRTGYNNN